MIYLKNIYYNIFNRGKLKLGIDLFFINRGKIEASGAYIGSVNNETTRLLNPRPGSLIVSGEFKIGKLSRIHKGCAVQVDGSFTIGNHSYLNPNCIVICKHNITIGDHCAIAWGCTIMDDHLHKTESLKQSSITIGNHVWIGSDCKIYKGAKIADGTVIAAGSIVLGETEPYSLYAGNPARLIKKNYKWQL
jgi:acetyltransferase-like isoleucine patch superfamily enzyme